MRIPEGPLRNPLGCKSCAILVIKVHSMAYAPPQPSLDHATLDRASLRGAVRWYLVALHFNCARSDFLLPAGGVMALKGTVLAVCLLGFPALTLNTLHA